MTEDWKFKKFEFGLRQDLKKVVVPLFIREFPALVEQVKVMEIWKIVAKLLNHKW